MKDMSEEKEWCEHIHKDNGWWHFRDWNLNLVEYMKFCPICGKGKPVNEQSFEVNRLTTLLAEAQNGLDFWKKKCEELERSRT